MTSGWRSRRPRARSRRLIRVGRGEAEGEAVASLLGFFDAGRRSAPASSRPTVDEAMDFVRTGTGAKTRYFNPGDGPIEEQWLPGFRIFVLGPPRSEQALFRPRRTRQFGAVRPGRRASERRDVVRLGQAGAADCRGNEARTTFESEFAVRRAVPPRHVNRTTRRRHVPGHLLRGRRQLAANRQRLAPPRVRIWRSSSTA